LIGESKTQRIAGLLDENYYARNPASVLRRFWPPVAERFQETVQHAAMQDRFTVVRDVLLASFPAMFDGSTCLKQLRQTTISGLCCFLYFIVQMRVRATL
jgi:hypothetical protein